MPLEFFENFKWAVPRALSSAVAICRFEQGDVLYSEQSGYQAWPDGGRDLRYQLQVLDPPKSARVLASEQAGSRFSTNWASQIEFELTDRLLGHTSGSISTQGRVFSCLWRGDPEWLSEESPAPEAPLGQRELHGRLEQIQGFVEARLARIAGQPLCVYLSAVDESSDAARLKAQAVQTSLSDSFSNLICDAFGPGEAGLNPDYGLHPALSLRVLAVPTADLEAVEKGLREALYAGTGHRFSVTRHGLLWGPLKF